MKLLFCLSFCLLFIQCYAQKKYAQLVNPFIGTAAHGHTFPGAVLPFGMVQLSPDTRNDDSWDGSSGYHYSDSVIYGFSHTHLSGTGCSDWGDILLMPFSYTTPVNTKNYAAAFKHSNENANAGYYNVKFDNGIETELTSTVRAGIHQYKYPQSVVPAILLDLSHRDKTTESYVKITGDNKIEGSRFSTGWAKRQQLYYVAEFSESFEWEIFFNDVSQKEFLLKDNYYSGKNVKAIFSFPKAKGKTIMVKVGISSVSIEGARKNLDAEASHWDFEKYKLAAENSWNKELSKIQLIENNNEKLTVFYTALYHCMIHPSTASDVDGNYLGRDFKIHNAKDFTYYSVFSLWDTYRALHPLLTLIDKKRTEDFIKTFIAQYEQGGRLPVWELSSSETDCMIGYHAVSVIADAYQKGIRGFDAEKAFAAMKNSAMEDRLGLSAYKKNNMITVDDEAESVSRTLEYAYDDWCIAQMAKSLKKNEDYQNFMKRSQSWKNLFDKQTAFFRARKNADWQTPFVPKQINNYYTEGNAWQYSFSVPHDIETLIHFFGNEKMLEAKLDTFFTTSSITSGREQADITGLIGQYAQGNEPSHHIAYLYNYVGKYDKAIKYIDTICNSFYKNAPDGLIGNDDCGQMSAWYVFSSMGFYPICPGSNKYVLGKPQFNEIKIALHNDQRFIINRSENYDYKNANTVQFSLNKINFNEIEIKHEQLMKGGFLEFKTTNSAIKRALPSTKYKAQAIAVTPIISCKENLFSDSTLIEIKSLESRPTNILFSINDSVKFSQYNKPFYIKNTATIHAYCYREKTKSSVAVAHINKRPNNWKIKLNTKYNNQYTAGGDLGLIDGIRGNENWKKGDWQGYQPDDVEAIIELDKVRYVSIVKASFLQDIRSWIFFPTSLQVFTSADGINFELAGEFKNTMDPKDETVSTQELGGTISKNKNIKFIKLIAKNFGKLPEWHPGRGYDAFIFIDEIIVE